MVDEEVESDQGYRRLGETDDSVTVLNCNVSGIPRSSPLFILSLRRNVEIPQSIPPGGDTGFDKLGRKETMNTKGYLTSSRRALDARNESQWSQTISPMLRLMPQLLRSSEIQLFEGIVGVALCFPLKSPLNPHYGVH